MEKVVEEKILPWEHINEEFIISCHHLFPCDFRNVHKLLYHEGIKTAIYKQILEQGDTERHTHRGCLTISLGSLSCIHYDSSSSFIPSFLTCQTSRLSSLHFSSSLPFCFALAPLSVYLKCILTTPISRSNTIDHNKHLSYTRQTQLSFRKHLRTISVFRLYHSIRGYLGDLLCISSVFQVILLTVFLPPASHKNIGERLQVQM